MKVLILAFLKLTLTGDSLISTNRITGIE